MRIKKFEIKNYKCLGPEGVSIDFSEDIVVLIGENNVGKSSVLYALRQFFTGGKKLPVEFFHNHQSDESHAVEIVVTFNELTNEEKQHRAVAPYFYRVGREEIWILKKTYYHNDKGECDYYAWKEADKDWQKNPGGLTQNNDDLFTEEKMQKIFVDAVKDVKEESGSGSKAAFGQIFNLLLKDELAGTDEYKDLMRDLQEYQKLFEPGSSFTAVREIENGITTKLGRVISAKSKIVVDPVNPDSITPIPHLRTNDGRKIDIDPQNQGHGLQRTLIFALLEMLAETNSPVNKEVGPRNLLMIEEPEIYMHPQMERKIADALYEIAAEGKAQVICTTHSPVFIRIAEKQRALVRLCRSSGTNEITVHQPGEIFTGPKGEEQKKRLRMITNFDPAVNEVFFAKRVVLVEGDTEIAVFRECAELMPEFLDPSHRHKRRDTTFVNCRGKWTITAFQEVLNHYQIDYVVIHDKDEMKVEAGANGAILKLLSHGEAQRMMFDRKIEDALGIADTGKEKPINALISIGKLKEEGRLEDVLGVYVRFAYGIGV